MTDGYANAPENGFQDTLKNSSRTLIILAQITARRLVYHTQ
jgi:hypothetical protein